MENIRVVYVLNGTTYIEQWQAKGISAQWSGRNLTVKFVEGDGNLVKQGQRTLSQRSNVKEVQYSQADYATVWETSG